MGGMTGSSPPAAVPLGQPADGAPPPGWYPDGVTPDSVRWFDGLRWTEHVRPASFGSDLGPSSAVHWLVPVGRSWQSITAGYLGLLGLVAPVCHGRRECDSTTGRRGRETGESISGLHV